MSWFDSSGLAGFAKTALTNAQKKIDKVLDIEEIDASSSTASTTTASTASTPPSSSRSSSRAPSKAGGGAYVPPAAPKTPSAINRDAELNSSEPAATGCEESGDWAHQSSLWSSWFDFGGKEQGGSEKSIEGSKRMIVAAQPPARAAKDAKSDGNVEESNGGANSHAHAARPVETETSQPSNVDKPKSSFSPSARTRKSTESKRAKPTPPKKLGQRLGEGKGDDAGGQSSIAEGEPLEETETEEEALAMTLPLAEMEVTSEAVLVSEIGIADNHSVDSSHDVDPHLVPAMSTLSIHDASSFSSQSSAPTMIVKPGQDRVSATLLTPSSSVSFDGGNSLSASACWEVKEGDADVDAILRKHEELVPSKVQRAPSIVNPPSLFEESEETSSSVVDSEGSQSRPARSISQTIFTTQPTLASQTRISSLSIEPSVISAPDELPLASNLTSIDNSLSSVLSSLSTTTTSLSDPTVIHAAHSEQDLTSFSLSQSSLSATKLTDSSTTEGTLGPEEEEEEDRVEEEDDDESMADVGNVISQVADVVSTPSPDVSGISGAVVDPLMSSSVSSVTSNVVKDLLGDAMTESLTSIPPTPTSDSSKSDLAPSGVKDPERKDASAAENDSYDDDEEDAGGSVSDCGKGSYNSSDEVNTGCTTSDEREETATSSDIEIISNPSILDGDANDRRFEVTSPLRNFGPLPLSSIDSSKDVIFHHQSLLHGQTFHQRTPSQSSSCSSSTNHDKKKNLLEWNELKIDTQERPCESDSPFESPNFGDSEIEEADAASKNIAAAEGDDAPSSRRRVESAPTEVEIEKSAGSVRQRLKEETEGGVPAADDAASGGVLGGGRRTPRMSRSRKSSERHLSTATLTASSEDKREEDDDDEDDDDGVGGGAPIGDAVVKELTMKMKDMAGVIQAREANAFDLSKMNAELTETITSLRQQLANAVAARDNSATEMDRMTEEFARRLGESENKLRATAQDRDAVKRELNQALKDVQSKAALEAIVKEKEDLVQELMDEGRKLSQQLGSANTALRKLRTKEKENEGVSLRRKEKAEVAEKRVEELEATLEEVGKREKTKASRLEQLEEKVQILESIKFEAESQMEDDQAKMESLKVSLEAANGEISSLKSRVIEADSLAAEAEGKAERNAVKMMEREFERAQETLIGEREALAAALEDLRVHVSRQERDVSRREDVLKQELSALQSRLQEADARNEQLVESMGGATLPLLRQIESLKLTMSTQASSWEVVEANLNDRLLEGQEQLISLEEKERVTSEELFDLRGRFTAEASKASSLSTEKTLLKTELETLKMKLTAAEEAKTAQALQTSSVKTALTQEINELKIVKLDLENQVQTLGTKVVELERRHRSVSPPASPRRSSTPRPFSPPPPPLVSHPSMSSIGATYSAPSLYNVVRESGGSFQIEEMQSQLKQKDGEICQLQTDIMNLELTRESMASELVELANKNTALEENIKHYPVLQKQHADMEVQYNALLQMFGEKAEEYDELRMDLEHVKAMYKQQIEELIQKESFRR